jgi:hypothetical protein
MAAPVHPLLEPLAALLGTWHGVGNGEYATIEPFTYEETVTFGHVGKPFLAYTQSTSADDGTPLHGEAGFWRPAGSGRLEVVIAHPTGHAEVADGTVDGTRYLVRSTEVTAVATAKEVTAIERDVVVDGDVLRYTLRMAAVGCPMSTHLSAELHRTA